MSGGEDHLVCLFDIENGPTQPIGQGGADATNAPAAASAASVSKGGWGEGGVVVIEGEQCWWGKT